MEPRTLDYFMECDCKITAAPEHNRLEPCAAHLEWMKALVRAEREECAKVADVFADECMRETYKAGGDKDAANAFRAQRVAAANIAGQIRRRTDS